MRWDVRCGVVSCRARLLVFSRSLTTGPPRPSADGDGCAVSVRLSSTGRDDMRDPASASACPVPARQAASSASAVEVRARWARALLLRVRASASRSVLHVRGRDHPLWRPPRACLRLGGTCLRVRCSDRRTDTTCYDDVARRESRRQRCTVLAWFPAFAPHPIRLVSVLFGSLRLRSAELPLRRVRACVKHYVSQANDSAGVSARGAGLAPGTTSSQRNLDRDVTPVQSCACTIVSALAASSAIVGSSRRPVGLDAVGRWEAEAIVLCWARSSMALQSTILEGVLNPGGVADKPQTAARSLLLVDVYSEYAASAERRICFALVSTTGENVAHDVRQAGRPLFFSSYDKRAIESSIVRPF